MGQGSYDLGLTSDKFNQEIKKLDDPNFGKMPTQGGFTPLTEETPMAGGSFSDSVKQGVDAALPTTDAMMKGVKEGAADTSGGFNMDSTLQMAAMASQLGSMFSGPPPPPPGGMGGGGSYNLGAPTSAQFSLRSIFGG